MTDRETGVEVALPRSHYLLQLSIVVGLTGIFLSSMSASDAIDGGVGRKVFLVLRMAFLVGLCSWFLKRDGERWADLGLRRPRRSWIVPLAAAGGFLLLIVFSILMMNWLLPAIGASLPKVESTPTAGADFVEYLFWAVVVSWGTAAVGEELLARGFILDRISKVVGSSGNSATLAAVVLQAAIFGSFHLYQGAGGVLMTAMAGGVLGLVWFFSGRNLWASILLHGIVDFLGANGM